MLQGVHFLDSKLLEFRDLLESGEVITDYNLCFLFSLIEQSLEMIEFNMNLIQSTRMSPGSGSYTKSAYENDAPAWQTGMFDARQ